MATATLLLLEDRVRDLLGRMTLAEKVGQMTQVEKNSITPDEVRAHGIGSVLSGGGGNPVANAPAAWAAMVRPFEEAALASRLGIPLLYGVDGLHGHNNLRGATIFPHNIGLGATRDADLVERVAEATARELLATHVNWTFAPAVSVPQDQRWGRTYEGFSEDTALVSEMGAASVRGLQRTRTRAGAARLPVLATPKHFVADGGTAWGSTSRYAWIPEMWQSASPERWQIDQGDARLDETTLRTRHLPPYAAAIAAGARCIMVSYSSWNGVKLHVHHKLLTDVLKQEMGFSGFLVSDWLAIDQLDADYDRAVAASINAGLDMIMVPFAWQKFIASVVRAVEQGVIAQARIDDAVTRILRVKLELGLFEAPIDDETPLAVIGAAEHRLVAREAVRKSLVLLQNARGALPLSRDADEMLVAGALADDLGAQCGGWTIEWQGREGRITEGTTILAALRMAAGAHSGVSYAADGGFGADTHAAQGVVVVGERPYAEGEGDCAQPRVCAEDVALVRRMRAICDRLTVVLISGRPLVVDEILPVCDALAASWLPGSEGQGIADVLFGDHPFTGKLPYSWPHAAADGEGSVLFPFGFGLLTA